MVALLLTVDALRPCSLVSLQVSPCPLGQLLVVNNRDCAVLSLRPEGRGDGRSSLLRTVAVVSRFALQSRSENYNATKVSCQEVRCERSCLPPELIESRRSWCLKISSWRETWRWRVSRRSRFCSSSNKLFLSWCISLNIAARAARPRRMRFFMLSATLLKAWVVPVRAGC